MVVSQRLGAPACQKQKSPVYYWCSRLDRATGLGAVCPSKRPDDKLAFPLGGTSPAQDQTRLNVGDG